MKTPLKHLGASILIALSATVAADPCADDLEESFGYQAGKGIGSASIGMSRLDTARMAQAFGEETVQVVMNGSGHGAKDPRVRSLAAKMLFEKCFKSRFLIGYRNGRWSLDHVDTARNAFESCVREIISPTRNPESPTPPTREEIDRRQLKGTTTPFFH